MMAFVIRAIAIVLLVIPLTGCIEEWLSGTSDLDCSDFDDPVWVGNVDPHNLDADNDGWGCEAN